MRKKVVIPLITFLVIIVLGIYFFSDNIIKNSLISAGEQAAQAKVEISDTNLSFFPLGLTIHNLKIADKDQPMRNLIEINSLNAKLQFSSLLKKKIIIDDIAVLSVSTGTKRKYSGALSKKKLRKRNKNENHKKTSSTGTEKIIPEKENVSKEKSSFDLSSLTQNVDATELLDKKELHMTKASSELQSLIKKKQTYWENEIKNFDISEQQSELQSQTNDLSSLSLSSLDDLKTLPETYKSISSITKGYQNLLNLISEKQSQLNADIKHINNGYQDLSTARDKDYKESLAELNVNHASPSRIGAALLGRSFTNKIEIIIEKLASIRSMLPKLSSNKPTAQNRLRGQDIHFKLTKKALPFLWIKKVSFSGEGNLLLNGKISNITSHQDLINEITTIYLEGQHKSHKNHTFKIEGMANFMNLNPIVNLTYAAQKTPISPFSLLKGDSPLTISGGHYNTLLQIKLNQNLIDGEMVIDAYEIKTKEKRAQNDLSTIGLVSNSLKTLSPLTIETEFSGSVFSPKFSINSNLDSHLSKEINRLAKQKVSDLSSSIKSQLDKELKNQEKVIEPLMSSFSKLQNSFTSTSSSVSKDASIITDKKNELKSKEKEITNKASAPLIKEQKKLEKQFKSQFKSLF